MEKTFQLKSEYRPQGDQPKAIEALVKNLQKVTACLPFWEPRVPKDIYNGACHRAASETHPCDCP